MRFNPVVSGILVMSSLILSLPAYGYIDPGTGSLIIQSIIGAIAAVGVTLKIYWHKIKVFFSGRGKDQKPAAEETSESK